MAEARSSEAIGRLRLRRRQTKAFAWTFSILLHFVLVGAMLSSAAGDLVAAESQGAEEGQMTVSLVAASSFRAESAPSGDLRPLLARYSDQPPVAFDPSRSRSEMTKLLQRLQSSDPLPPSDSTDDRAPSSRPPTERPTAERDSRAGGSSGRDRALGADRRGSTGGLWGAVEPCWRDLARGSAVPVTLEVIVDVQGQLTTPPRIIRSASAAIDEPRLLAEARALSALAACMPRGDLRFSGKMYRLDFLPSP